MRTVDGVLGNVHEDELLSAAIEHHEDAGTLERVEVDAADRVKSRLRVTTDAGTELGVVLGRDELRDGDVLLAEEDAMVVVEFAAREALAIDLPAAADRTTLVELGHLVGNQHWDLATRDDAAYVALDAGREVVERVIGDALPDAATTRVESVDGALFVDDAAGAGTPDHDHVESSRRDDGHDHSHAHGSAHASQAHGHGHDHSHGDGSGHGHGHERDSSHGQRPGHDHERSGTHGPTDVAVRGSTRDSNEPAEPADASGEPRGDGS